MRPGCFLPYCGRRSRPATKRLTGVPLAWPRTACTRGGPRHARGSRSAGTPRPRRRRSPAARRHPRPACGTWASTPRARGTAACPRAAAARSHSLAPTCQVNMRSRARARPVVDHRDFALHDSSSTLHGAGLPPRPAPPHGGAPAHLVPRTRSRWAGISSSCAESHSEQSSGSPSRNWKP